MRPVVISGRGPVRATASRVQLFRLFAKAASIAGFVVAAVAMSACTVDSTTSSGSEEAAVTSSVAEAITTTTKGTAYAQKCSDNGVPLPPAWGTTTIGAPGSNKAWIDNGVYRDGFFGLNGHIYYSQSSTPAGICVLNAHFENLFDVICEGKNGKACFWEGSRDYNPPATPIILADKTVASSVVFGGADIATADRCTSCHAGENAFLTHYVPGHALNLNDKIGWSPATQTSFLDPIVPAGYPQPGASPTNYAPTCTGACHTAGGIGGRFPDLRTSKFTDHFCSLLDIVTRRTGAEGGMPPDQNCDESNGALCSRHTDKGVRAMIAACAAPNPPVPTSISGLAAPNGVGNEFLAGRRHISASAPGEHQHYFTGATETMPGTSAPGVACCRNQAAHPKLRLTDKINVSVWLPSDDMPTEVMVQVYNGSTWYRAYWGADKITGWGARKNKGSLPSSNSWTTLSFTPGDLGMPDNSVLSGMAFTLFDGSASWADVLFKSNDAPNSGNNVSQMWVWDSLPTGAVTGSDGGDYWWWAPSITTTSSPSGDQDGPDLAKGGSTYMSTDPFGASASRGNDGNLSGNWADGSVFHTGTGYDSSSIISPGGEYWFVDLRGLHTVKRVVIHNRTDCCQDRLSHFRINYWHPTQNKWVMLSDQSGFIASTTNPVMNLQRHPDGDHVHHDPKDRLELPPLG